MLRCSVTELDAYRRYRLDEGAALDELLRQLRREEPPSRAMLAGKALHHILEHAEAGQDLETAEHDGFKFRFELDCALPMPAVRELKGETILPTSVGPVVLVGVVDGLHGAVRDYKLTARFDAERYFASYQWRCYLAMFNAREFQYDVFVGADKEERGEIAVTEYHPLRLFAYTTMRDDVLREVEEFARFAVRYLPERFPHDEVAIWPA